MHFSVLYITFLLFYVYCPALEESLTSCVTFTTAAPCANTPARGCNTPATHEAEPIHAVSQVRGVLISS